MPTPRVGPTERARRAAVKRASAATAAAATQAAASAAAAVLSTEVLLVQAASDSEQAIKLLEEAELKKYEAEEPRESDWLKAVNAAEREKIANGYPKIASTDGWSNTRESDEVRQAAWELHTSLKGDADLEVFKAGQHALGGDDAFKVWVDQHPWRSRTASAVTRAKAGVYLRLWSIKEALLYSNEHTKRARCDNPSQADARVHCAVNSTGAPAQVPAVVTPVAATTVPDVLVAPSLGVQQPLTHEEDMRDLRKAAQESMNEFHEAARKHELAQQQWDAAIHASRNPSVPAGGVAAGGSYAGGAAAGGSAAGGSAAGGAAAGGSGVGSQECTQEQLQSLQVPDTRLSVDPRGKALAKSIGQCDNELLQQRSALQDPYQVQFSNSAAHAIPAVVSVPVVPVLSVASVEAHNAQKNMEAATAAYQAALVAPVPLSSNELTAVNTRTNSVLPSPQMQRPGRNQVAFSLPHSEPAVPESPVSQSQGRQLAMPSTLGTGRYPEIVQFHHIMEHYIKLNNAEIARNTIDLAAVVPVATPVLATVSVPSTSQSVAVVPLAVPTILDSVIGSRSALPDFIVGGYKVYSDKSGDLKDNEVFKSYKYKSDFARTLASKVNIFVDNTSGHGQSYEDWRLIFANAVGNEHYVDDFVMGDWLRGLLHQEVANDVDMFMGVDDLGTSIYRHCSAKVLDTYLLGSIYASQLTDHHFNTEMQRVQGSHENSQEYVRE